MPLKFSLERAVKRSFGPVSQPKRATLHPPQGVSQLPAHTHILPVPGKFSACQSAQLHTILGSQHWGNSFLTWAKLPSFFPFPNQSSLIFIFKVSYSCPLLELSVLSVAKPLKHSLYDMVFRPLTILDTLVCQYPSENVAPSPGHSIPDVV